MHAFLRLSMVRRNLQHWRSRHGDVICPRRFWIQLKAVEIKVEITSQKIIEMLIKVKGWLRCDLRFLRLSMGLKVLLVSPQPRPRAQTRIRWVLTSVLGSTRSMKDCTTLRNDRRWVHLVSKSCNSRSARLRSACSLFRNSLMCPVMTLRQLTWSDSLWHSCFDLLHKRGSDIRKIPCRRNLAKSSRYLWTYPWSKATRLFEQMLL